MNLFVIALCTAFVFYCIHGMIYNYENSKENARELRYKGMTISQQCAAERLEMANRSKWSVILDKTLFVVMISSAFVAGISFLIIWFYVSMYVFGFVAWFLGIRQGGELLWFWIFFGPIVWMWYGGKLPIPDPSNWGNGDKGPP